MKRLARFIILIPVAIILIAFSVANRSPVALSFDPFSPASPAISVAMPLFVLLFLVFLLGVVVGGAVTWMRQGRWRRRARARREEMQRLRREMAMAGVVPPAEASMDGQPG